MSNWYPFNTNYEASDNLLHYGTLYNTSQVFLVEVEEEVIAKKLIDPCGLCTPITKTKETNNSAMRYSGAVKINFIMAVLVCEQIYVIKSFYYILFI